MTRASSAAGGKCGTLPAFRFDGVFISHNGSSLILNPAPMR